jgi:hypothetical protein
MENLQDVLDAATKNYQEQSRVVALKMAKELNNAGDAVNLLKEADLIYEWLINKKI